jgi:hypothetical protein
MGASLHITLWPVSRLLQGGGDGYCRFHLIVSVTSTFNKYSITVEQLFFTWNTFTKIMHKQYVLTPLHSETAVQTTNRHSQDRWPKLICQLGALVSNCTNFLYELNPVFHYQDQKRIGLFLKVYFMKSSIKLRKLFPWSSAVAIFSV